MRGQLRHLSQGVRLVEEQNNMLNWFIRTRFDTNGSEIFCSVKSEDGGKENSSVHQRRTFF